MLALELAESSPRSKLGGDWGNDTYRLLFRKITRGTEYHDDSVILQLDGAGIERHCQWWNGVANLTTAKSVLKKSCTEGLWRGVGKGYREAMTM